TTIGPTAPPCVRQIGRLHRMVAHAKGRYPTRPIQRGWVGVLAVGGALHMTRHLDRREFIQLAGLATAGVAGGVFAAWLRGVSLAAAKGKGEDFMFLQMSDLHWGLDRKSVV